MIFFRISKCLFHYEVFRQVFLMLAFVLKTVECLILMYFKGQPTSRKSKEFAECFQSAWFLFFSQIVTFKIALEGFGN